jgi:RNA polymerase sigma-70 factor (ECF subfamily)
MLQVRDGDAEAFQELVLRYQNRLVALLAHLVGSRDKAEDLTQDVFLRVFRAKQQYVPGSKFSTWLYTIANNVARNHLRSMSRRHEVNLAPSKGNNHDARPLENAALAASAMMPSRQIEKDELCAAVQAAIASLNDRQREAMLLSKFENMSYAEIAEIMDMTPQAIKSLLSRARNRVREALQPYLERGDKVDE